MGYSPTLHLASHVIDRLTSLQYDSHYPINFGKEYEGQHPITTALKIIHQSVVSGTQVYNTKLRKQIKVINHLLKTGEINPQAKRKFGIDMSQEIEAMKEMQIALPQTRFQKMVKVATIIPRIAFTVLTDFSLFILSLIILPIAYCQPSFNPKPKDIKIGKTPILLLHGSGSNDCQWIIGRLFLKDKKYGSVFSFNLDGLISNDSKKGIDDYARDKVRKEIKKIKVLTSSDRIILIGHSMGGMIASEYAEQFAEKDGINANDIISIATPWQGAPLIDYRWKLGGFCSKKNETVRHLQMSILGGTTANPNFRQNLVAKALHSERTKKRNYYHILSTTDYATPNNCGMITEDPRRQCVFDFLGHYGIALWPGTWLKIRSWLDQIYAAEQTAKNY